MATVQTPAADTRVRVEEVVDGSGKFRVYELKELSKAEKTTRMEPTRWEFDSEHANEKAAEARAAALRNKRR